MEDRSTASVRDKDGPFGDVNDDRHATKPALWSLLLTGVVMIRLVSTGHAPNFVDASTALALALLLLRTSWAGDPIDRACVITLAGAGLAALLSIATSWHPLLSAWALPGFLAPFLAFALVRAQTIASREMVATGVALATTLHAVAAVIQRLIIYPDALARADALQLTPDVRNTLGALRPLGLSLSPDLAGGLALLAAITGLFFLLSPNRANRPRVLIRRLFGVACVFSGITALVASRSAGSALALGVATFVFILVQRSAHVTRWQVALLGGVSMLAAAFSFRGVAALSASASERLHNWSVALQLAIDHPLGVGLGRFGPAYLEARTPESNVTRYAHNAWLHGWAELGLPGLCLMGLLCIGGIKLWKQVPLDERRQRALWLAAGAALLTRASIDYDLQIGQTAVGFGVIAGLSLGHSQHAAYAAPRWVQRLLAVAVTVACLFPLTGLLAREQALAPYVAGGDPDQQDPVQLIHFANEYPGDVTANTQAARVEFTVLMKCARPFTGACRSLNTALRQRLELAHRSPSADGLHLVAAQLAMTIDNDLLRAEREVRQALKAHPGSPLAWRLLAEMARTQGDGRLNEVCREAALWQTKSQTRAFCPPGSSP